MKKEKICFSKQNALIVFILIAVVLSILKLSSFLNISKQGTDSRAAAPESCQFINLAECRDAYMTGECMRGTCKMCAGSVGRYSCTQSNEIEAKISIKTPKGYEIDNTYSSTPTITNLYSKAKYTVTSTHNLVELVEKNPSIQILKQSLTCDKNSTSPVASVFGVSGHTHNTSCTYNAPGAYTIQYQVAYKMNTGSEQKKTFESQVKVKDANVVPCDEKNLCKGANEICIVRDELGQFCSKQFNTKLIPKDKNFDYARMFVNKPYSFGVETEAAFGTYMSDFYCEKGLPELGSTVGLGPLDIIGSDISTTCTYTTPGTHTIYTQISVTQGNTTVKGAPQEWKLDIKE